MFIFKFKLLNEEMNAGKINLSVFNANTIFRNELIGAHEVDVMRAYNSPGIKYLYHPLPYLKNYRA